MAQRGEPSAYSGGLGVEWFGGGMDDAYGR